MCSRGLDGCRTLALFARPATTRCALLADKPSAHDDGVGLHRDELPELRGALVDRKIGLFPSLLDLHQRVVDRTDENAPLRLVRVVARTEILHCLVQLRLLPEEVDVEVLRQLSLASGTNLVPQDLLGLTLEDPSDQSVDDLFTALCSGPDPAVVTLVVQYGHLPLLSSFR